MSKTFRRNVPSEEIYFDVQVVREALYPKILKIVKDMGYELVDFTIKKGKSVVVEVEIYLKHRDISIKDCEKVSNVISRALDVENLIPVRYNLLVSSPGVDRVFRNTREYDVFSGKEVEVKIKNFESYNLTKEVNVGTLLGIDGDVVKFKIGEREIWVDLSDIEYTRLYFDIDKYFGGK
ncbi:MAG: ribosome maturation factor RimP [Brevinematia bacterium]